MVVLFYVFLILLCIGFSAKLVKYLWSATKFVLICAITIITLPITIPYVIIKAFRDEVRNKQLCESLQKELKHGNFLEALRLIKTHNPDDFETTIHTIKNKEIDLDTLKTNLNPYYLKTINKSINNSLSILTGSNFLELSNLTLSLQPIYDWYHLEEGDIPLPREIIETKASLRELEIQTPYTQDKEKSVTLVRRYIPDVFPENAIEI